MQENNFEKQVQQKIDELIVKPSDEVWQRVAVVIAKRRRSWRMIAIVFLVSLFVGAGIFIVWNRVAGIKEDKLIAVKNNPPKINSISHQFVNESIAVQKPIVTNITETNKKVSSPDNSILIKTIRVQKRIINQQKNIPIPPISKTISAIAAPANTNKEDAENLTEIVPNLNIKIGKKISGRLSTVIAKGTPEQSVDERINIYDSTETNIVVTTPANNELVTIDQVAHPISKDKINKELKSGDTLTMTPLPEYKKDITVKKPSLSKQKTKWNLGFNFSLGVAATQNGVLAAIGVGNGDASKSFAERNQIYASTSPPVPNILYTPSKIKSGTGFVAGFFIEKNISPKTNFLIGLNYKTYNSTVLIGNRVDSSMVFYQGFANDFYRSGSSTKYRNNFHFIELPVSFQFKISKQNKRSIYLNTGISISQLIASNTLQFDIFSGAYYNSNNLFNKTQFNMSAGLLFALSKQAKNPLLIGPDINFSVSKIANSGLYKNLHYSYFGVLLQKGIGKK